MPEPPRVVIDRGGRLALFASNQPAVSFSIDTGSQFLAHAVSEFRR
jgi:hypothetical protein